MEEAYNYLLKNIEIKYNDTLVAGVSGGPDSMALLSLLLRLKKALDINIICAQINHNTGRKGQAEEQLFVQNYCKQNGLICETLTIEKYGDDNFHNEARNIRYNFFEDLIRKYQAKFLLTAHHADDLIETILMRIVRGSTLKGYSGFQEKIKKDKYTIIRPLIHVTKDNIYKYLKENKIKYMEDSSNDSDTYTRNRFRRHIIPALKKEDANVHKKFYKLSQTLLSYSDYIDTITDKVSKEIYVQNTLNIEKFTLLEDLIKVRLVYRILEEFYQDDLILISDTHVDIILDLIKNKKPNAKIHLPNNILAIKSYNTLVLTKINEDINDFEIEINDFVNLPNGKNIVKVLNSNKDGNDICRVNSKEVTLPLYVRNKNKGDKMAIKGMLGSKKISDIFIDKKIPQDKRLTWPVVCDSKENVIWLPGLKKSKFNKSKEENCDIILKYY